MTGLRRRRHEFLAAALGVSLALGLLEALLHARVLPLSAALETHLFQCYTPLDELDSIAFGSTSLGLTLGRPKMDTWCSVNGYRWHHQSDRWGMRNPRDLTQAEIVVLGDSQVYGQGVEEPATFARRLEGELGVTVANLGRTHAGPAHYLALFSNFGLSLHPRTALVVFFENDLSDVLEYRPLSSVRRFLATEQGSEARIVPLERLFSEDDRARPGHAWRALEQRLLVYRSLRYTVARLVGLTAFPERLELGTEGQPLAARYLEQATRLMARRASENGVRLLLTNLSSVDEKGDWRRHATGECVARTAASLGLPLLDLKRCLGNEQRPDPGVFLERDHHLSPEGHRRVAACLARFVRAQGGA